MGQFDFLFTYPSVQWRQNFCRIQIQWLCVARICVGNTIEMSWQWRSLYLNPSLLPTQIFFKKRTLIGIRHELWSRLNTMPSIHYSWHFIRTLFSVHRLSALSVAFASFKCISLHYICAIAVLKAIRMCKHKNNAKKIP